MADQDESTTSAFIGGLRKGAVGAATNAARGAARVGGLLMPGQTEFSADEEKAMRQGNRASSDSNDK